MIYGVVPFPTTFSDP